MLIGGLRSHLLEPVTIIGIAKGTIVKIEEREATTIGGCSTVSVTIDSGSGLYTTFICTSHYLIASRTEGIWVGSNPILHNPEPGLLFPLPTD